MLTETIVAKGQRFTIFETDYGFSIRRDSDGRAITIDGDDQSEDFRDRFPGDLSGDLADDPENGASADELGEAMEADGDFGPLPPAREIALALLDLKRARERLVKAGAERAADKVRAALKSAEGAERHAIGKSMRSA